VEASGSGEAMIRKLAGALVVLAVSAIVSSIPSEAAPWDDPHHPNPGNSFCPGGGVILDTGKGWCDGVDYPDGSFWHSVPMPYFGIYRVATGCYLHGGLFMQQAPPGGCGGEW
jgi:hypothetical protein